MFHSAALKLTLWYLAIIMALSIAFSGVLYRLSANNLEHSANRQIGYFNNFLGPGELDNYSLMRQHQLNQDIERLRANLVFFNLIVIVGGGAASYWLARRTLEPIERALESQSRFAADASHELRTPLTAIQTENEVALRNPNLKKDQAVGLLKSNLEEVAKLKALSNGLLRLASGGRVEKPEPVSIKEALDKAVAQQEKPASLKHVKINARYSDYSVKGDPDNLSELFTIIIDNAVKYSTPGSSVDVSAQKHHREVTISVRDRGQGIAGGDLPKIFDRFYQADSSRSKQKTSGYGLGLAIAKRISEAHGGHIEVRSTLGKGSSFIVHLPSA